VENNGEALPHVFFGIDVANGIVAAYRGVEFDGDRYDDLDWSGLLRYLDEVYSPAPLVVKQVIVTSLLLQLPWPHEAGYEIVSHLGPVLAPKFAEVRPYG
jgi:hypothetical protein